MRVLLGLVAAVGGYDAVSNQFGLPTLRKLLGLSGSLLPWWGWVIALEAVVIYALFEYVQRNAKSESVTLKGAVVEPAAQQYALDLREFVLSKLEEMLSQYLTVFYCVKGVADSKSGVNQVAVGWAEEALHKGMRAKYWTIKCLSESPIEAMPLDDLEQGIAQFLRDYFDQRKYAVQVALLYEIPLNTKRGNPDLSTKKWLSAQERVRLALKDLRASPLATELKRDELLERLKESPLNS